MSAILESALDGERRAECAKHDAEQGLNPTMQQALSDAQRAAEFWAGVASQEGQRKAKTAHGITHTSPVKVSGKHLSDAANEPEPVAFASDRALAAGFAGEPFALRDAS